MVHRNALLEWFIAKNDGLQRRKDEKTFYLTLKLAVIKTSIYSF